MEAGAERRAVLAEPLDDVGALLRHDHRGLARRSKTTRTREHRRRRSVPRVMRAPPVLSSARTQSVRPSTPHHAAALPATARGRRGSAPSTSCRAARPCRPRRAGGRRAAWRPRRSVSIGGVPTRAATRRGRAEEQQRDDREHREEQPLQPPGRRAEPDEHPDDERGDAEEEDEEAARGDHLDTHQHEADEHPHPPVHRVRSVARGPRAEESAGSREAATRGTPRAPPSTAARARDRAPARCPARRTS